MSGSEFQIYRFGSEQQPIVAIDNFIADLGALQTLGRAAAYGPAGRHYPGLRAAAPSQYLQERGLVLGQILAEVFGCHRGADLIECNFSIVTTPPTALTPIQRLPHFDGADAQKLALLHYLGAAEEGGTSFYRHRATGFETITPARIADYDAALRAEIATAGLPPARYFAGSTDQFERIGQIAAKPNRMVIYRGITLHSGDIFNAEALCDDPKSARLTVNTFLAAR